MMGEAMTGMVLSRSDECRCVCVWECLCVVVQNANVYEIYHTCIHKHVIGVQDRMIYISS